MSVVWIVADRGHDYGGAEKFGAPRVLFSSAVSSLNVARYRERLESVAPQADDLLLLSGNLLPNVVAVAWWKERFGSCRCLVFNAKHGVYVEVVL